MIRYEKTAGVRVNADNDRELDLDLGIYGPGFAKLWLGHIDDTRAEKVLTPNEVRALRDACARILVRVFGNDQDKMVLHMIEAEL